MKLLAAGKAGDAGSATSRRIAGNTLITIGVRVAISAASLVTIAVLARALGPAEFGVWTTALAFVSLFSFLTDLGLVQIATQKMSADPERESEWLGALTAMRLALSGLALATCLLALPLLDGEGNVRSVAAVLSFTVLTAAFGALLAVFQSRLRAGVTMALLAFQSVAWTGTVIVLASTDADVMTFAVAFNVVALVSGLLQLAVTRRSAHIAFNRGRELWRELVRLALPLAISGLMIIVYYRVDSVLLYNLRGAEEAGIYGAAYRFLDPLQFLPAAVMASLFPVFAAVFESDRPRAERLVQGGVDYLAVISFPILAGSIALADPLVDAVFGGGFARAADVLPLLMGAFVSICFGYLAGYLAPVIGLQWRYAAYATAGAVANVGLNLLLIPRHGAVGAAWATLVTEVLTMSLLLVTVLRALGLRPRLAKVGKAAVAATVMALAAAAVAPVGLVPAMLVAFVVYPAALLALRVVVPHEVRAQLAERREA